MRIFIVWADMGARIAIAPEEMPIGIINSSLWWSVLHLDVETPKIYIWRGGLVMLKLADVSYSIEEKEILKRISLDHS